MCTHMHASAWGRGQLDYMQKYCELAAVAWRQCNAICVRFESEKKKVYLGSLAMSNYRFVIILLKQKFRQHYVPNIQLHTFTLVSSQALLLSCDSFSFI